MAKTNKMFDFIKSRKLFLGISLAIMLVGIVFNVIFGTQLDIQFKGGTIFSFSYTGDMNATEIQDTIKNATGLNTTVTFTSDISGNSKQFTATLTDELENKFVYSYTGEVANLDEIKETANSVLGITVNVTKDDKFITIAPENKDARITEASITTLDEEIQTLLTDNEPTLVYSASATGLSSVIGTAISEAFGTQLVYTVSSDKFDTEALTTALNGVINYSVTAKINDEGKLVVAPIEADKTFGEDTAKITEQVNAIDSSAALEKEVTNAIESVKSNSVKPTVGKGFFIKCIFAVVFGAILVTIYIGIRFRKIGGVSAAIFAMLALLHDCIITYFVYVIFQIPLDSNFIAVMLTLLGYSLNDTIVIYDRIRENEVIYGRTKTISEIVNLSVNQCFTRNINTSLATFVAVAAVGVIAMLNGITSINSFALPMAVGIIAGCYSSVLLSSPIWAAWREHKIKKTK